MVGGKIQKSPTRWREAISVPLLSSLGFCQFSDFYIQVVQVHQNTVDTYLEDIILGAIDNTAHEQVIN